jgi:hypothetical protein
LYFLQDICIMKKSIAIFICSLINNLLIAQTGLQVGFDGCTVRNTNQQTNVFPFSPVISYELAAVYKVALNDRLFYKLELGFVNKGGNQSAGGVVQAIEKHAIGYAYVGFNLLYTVGNDWNLKLGVNPSYLMLYKRYNKGVVSNYITAIDSRYKVDVPLTLGISKMVGQLNEFTIQFSHSTAPFAVQKNIFPIPSTDKFYHANIALLYTFYFANKNSNE